MAPQIKTHSTKHLLIGYVALAVLFVALWFVDSRQIEQQRNIINETGLATKKMRLIADLIEIARKRTRLSHQMISLDDIFAKDDVYLQIENLAGLFASKLYDFETLPLNQFEKDLLAQQREIYPEVIKKLENVMTLVIEEDTEQADMIARNIVINEIVPLQENIVDGFMQIMTGIQNNVSESSKLSTLEHEKNTTYRLLLITVIFIASLGVLFKVMRLMHNIEKNLQSDSLTDGLTGIANRRCFDHMLMHEWKKSQRSKHPLSLLLIDIDFFKKYNDFYGHQQGDECLIDVSKIIKSATHRQSDIAARYGGEEFGIILPETDTAGAMTVANGLLEEIRRKKLPHLKSEIEDFITLSIGVASVVAESKTGYESVIKAADDALYTSKKNGRNRVTVFSQKAIESLN